MIYGIYSIKDLKTSFLSPTVDINDDTATRNFYHACMRSDSLFFTCPEDYSLYKLADYDSDSGEIKPLKSPKFICNAFRKDSKNE